MLEELSSMLRSTKPSTQLHGKGWDWLRHVTETVCLANWCLNDVNCHCDSNWIMGKIVHLSPSIGSCYNGNSLQTVASVLKEQDSSPDSELQSELLAEWSFFRWCQIISKSCVIEILKHLVVCVWLSHNDKTVWHIQLAHLQQQSRQFVWFDY